MTKIKKIVAAAIAAVSMGAIGLTALAVSEPDNYFRFSLEGRDDRYFDTTGAVIKTNSWNIPAEVLIESSNLNATHRAYLSVTGDYNWPENYILSETKMANGNIDFKLSYKANPVVHLPVYLLATTGDDIWLDGYWQP